MTSKKYIGSIDQGTTSTRFILFDHDGVPCFSSQREHTQYFPQSAWVEHDPEEIWATTRDIIKETLDKSGVSARDVVALGITNQRETVVVWDKNTGKPLHNALVWQDQRGASLCNSLADERDPSTGEPYGKDRIRHLTGLPIVPYFSASKLRWLLDNVPGLREKAENGSAIAGTIDSYLLWKLTGSEGVQHYTDVTNACRTLLFDIHKLEWSQELCDLFKIPMKMLPAVKPSSGSFGLCNDSGVLPGVPISGVVGDQQAALFGQAAFQIGDAKNTYGTGCFLLMNTGETPVPSNTGLLTTVAYQIEGQKPVYALEGSVAVAGAVTTWLRDNLGVIRHYGELQSLCESIASTDGLVFVPAFNGLFAPHWRSDARGIMIGLSGHVTKAHMARAAVEAVAHQTRELLDAMTADAKKGLGKNASENDIQFEKARSLKVDGGMSQNDFLMQFQADITSVDVQRPHVIETTALGAAYSAGLAVGFWGSLEELTHHWKIGRVFSPASDPHTVGESIANWNRALSRCLYWTSEDEKQRVSLASSSTCSSSSADPTIPSDSTFSSTDPTLTTPAVASAQLADATNKSLTIKKQDPFLSFHPGSPPPELPASPLAVPPACTSPKLPPPPSLPADRARPPFAIRAGSGRYYGVLAGFLAGTAVGVAVGIALSRR